MRIFFYILMFIFISCSDSPQTLPSSIGSSNEIIIVIDDNLWEESYSNLFRSVFEKELIGVSSYETKFKLLQINNSEFNRLLKTHRNIILVNKNISSKSNNKWASNQLVFNLSFSDTSSIIKDLNSIFSSIESFLYQSSRKQLLKSFNADASSILKTNFLIDALIPKDYEIVLDSINSLWLSYNPANKEVIKHLMFFQVDSLDVLNPHLIINKKLFKYLKGPQEGSYVEIEARYPLVFEDNFFRGLWRLKNGFMGGPLLSRIIRNNTGTYIMIALVFSPNTPKRKFIKEVESIL